MESNTDDRRRFIRSPVPTDVEVNSDFGLIDVEGCRDVGLKGIYIYTGSKLDTGTPCQVRIHLGERESKISIFCNGKVVHQGFDGLGIEFTDIGAESYEHLKLLVLYNSPNPQMAEEEFKKIMGIK